MAGDIKVDVGSIVTGLGSIVNNIRGKIPVEMQADLEKKLIDLDAAVQASQSAVNAVEAASSSWFVRSWRPACAWVCVVAFALQYLIRPIISWIIPSATFPAIDTGEMMPLLFGLLGLGTMRSFDKLKGITK
jgi:hypothetical protein